jgi:hypothetical protein
MLKSPWRASDRREKTAKKKKKKISRILLEAAALVESGPEPEAN